MERTNLFTMLAFNLLSYFGVFLFAFGFPLLLILLVRKVSLDTGIFPIIVAGIMVFGGLGLIFGGKSLCLQKAINEKYTFYLDGQEVDVNTIDVDHYRVSYDENNHTVMLSQRRGLL